MKKLGIYLLMITMLAGLLPMGKEDVQAAKAREQKQESDGKTYVADSDAWSGQNLEAGKSAVHYYGGTQGLVLKKENVTETATATNTTLYQIKKDGIHTDFTLTWEVWYLSKNSQGFARLDVTTYDENRQKIAYHYGNQVMLSRNEENSLWQRLETSEVVSEKTTYVSFTITVTDGYNYLWMDEIAVSAKENTIQSNEEAIGSHGWEAEALWYPEDPKTEAIGQARYFRTRFQIKKDIHTAYIQMAADDSSWHQVFVNCTSSKVGLTQVAKKEGDDRGTAYVYDMTDRVKKGENILAIRVHNVNSVAGVIFELYLTYTDGSSEILCSNSENTKVSRLNCVSENDFFNKPESQFEVPANWYTVDFEDRTWVAARNLGIPPYSNMPTPNYVYGYKPCYTIQTDTIPKKTVTGGTEAKISFTYTKEQYTDRKPETVTGLLYQEDTLLAHLTMQTTFQSGKATFTCKIPDYLPEGTYTLKIQKDKLRILGGADTDLLCQLTLKEPDKKCGEATVKKENGIVRLYVNGIKTSPILYLRPHHNIYYDYEKLKGVQDAGITLYATYNGQLDGADGNPIWTGPDTIDYEAFDREIYRTLDLQQDAMLMVNMAMNAPQWWLQEHPEECLAEEDGNPIRFSDSEGPYRVSFASEKYRQEAAEVVKKLTQHMKEASYRNRVCAVKLIGGHTYEWKQYNQDDEGATNKWLAIDYSKAMKDSFKKATGYEVPSVARRSQSIYTTLLDPATQADVIAYNEYISQVVTDSFLTYAKAVKEIMPTWLVGGYNGYLWFENSTLGIGGCHTTVEQVLDSPYIDFIASPVNYSERIAGYQTGYMAMSESIAAHGKLYLLEQDNRTLDGHVFGNALSDNAVGLETTEEGSVKQLTRDMTRDFVQGNGFWLYDMEGGWFYRTAITDAIAKVKEEYDKSLNQDLSTNSQVAVYVGADFYSQLVSDTIGGGNASRGTYLVSQLYNKQRLQLSKMGTSYDTYMLEDLTSKSAQVDWSQYRLHIVLSPIAMDQETRNALETKVKTNGNTVLWIYLPGVSDTEKIHSDNLAEVTDMNVNLIQEGALNLTGTITDSRFGTVGNSYGVDYGYTYETPYAVVKDSDAEPLATYDNKKGIAAAIKTCKNYTSIYSGVPCVTAESLRKICKMAGVHLYTEDQDAVIDTNAGYLSLYSQTPGKKTITLPESYTVYDVYAGNKLGENLTSFTVETEKAQTCLYRLEKKKVHTHTAAVKVTKKATFTSAGTRQTYCKTCNANLKKAETIPAAKNVTLSKATLTYSGKTQKINIQVKDASGKVISPKEYTVTGNTGKQVGNYKLTVTFRSSSASYTGKKTISWKILPKKTTLKKITPGRKCLTVKWSRQTAGVTGYKIQYSTSSNFKKNVKTVTIKKNKITSYTIRKLKAKQRYYVRICTYKGKLPSGWSKVKKCRTK